MHRTRCASFTLAALVAASAAVPAHGQRSTARPSHTPAPYDWPQFGGNAAHTSTSAAPTGIDAANVATLERQRVTIDGTVDASAIYLHDIQVRGAVHDVLFVTTTYGKTIAIDARDGAILWTYTPPDYDAWAGSRQITNSTPAADPDRAFIYAASPDGYIQKLAVADGRVAWRTAITRLARREKIASPLTYFAGRVIAVTGGYIGDAPPYQGHVAVLDARTGRLVHVWNSLCSDRAALLDPSDCPESGSAIWGRAGAVIDSATGAIFVATGNGRWDGRTNWGDAMMQLDSSASRVLANYTPENTDELNRTDADVGSTSPVLLGGGVVAQGGKDGTIRVLRLDRLRGPAPHRGGETQRVSTPSGSALFTAPAVLHAAGITWMFAADYGGTAAWTFRDGRLEQRWHNERGGTSPVVAGGLLYVYDPRGSLRVYRPETGEQIAELDCGSGHWNSPIVVDGLIALPEGSANGRGEHGVLNIWRVR